MGGMFTRRGMLQAAGLMLPAAGITLDARAQAPAPQAPPPKWLRLSSEARLERIAFGSCLDQRLAQPIWTPIAAARPDVMIMMGDNVYGDVSDAAMGELKAAYAMQAARPELAGPRAAIPFLATWDDHDYGLNDGGADFPHKAASRQIFAEFWGLAPAELPAEGIFRAGVYGPPGARVQVILLDMRTFRAPFARLPAAERLAGAGPYTPDPDPVKPMLGAAQWAWLEAQLAVPAEIRLLVSSTQLLAEAHGWERWGHLPAERERLFALIKRSGAKGLLVLSGDRHRAQIYKRSEGLAYPLYDITSSALNRSRAGGEPDDPGRLGAMLAEDNFGLISIDWAGRRIKASVIPLSGREGPAIDLAFGALGLP